MEIGKKYFSKKVREVSIIVYNDNEENKTYVKQVICDEFRANSKTPVEFVVDDVENFTRYKFYIDAKKEALLRKILEMMDHYKIIEHFMIY